MLSEEEEEEDEESELEPQDTNEQLGYMGEHLTNKDAQQSLTTNTLP